jgi:hypothetical protein
MTSMGTASRSIADLIGSLLSNAVPYLADTVPPDNAS